MKPRVDEDDIRDILQLKIMATNDHTFKRYIYNITEEEQTQYGFEFIGHYSSAPNPSTYNLNTTYRNTYDKTVYIKTKRGWDVFLKDGSDGRNGSSGGGMGFKDVSNLIDEKLKGYTPSTSGNPGTSGGTYYGLNGIVPLYTSASVYTVTHDLINYLQMAPILSLNIPTASSQMVLTTICNHGPTSFDIVLSEAPPEDGYSISWFIPNTNGAEGTVTIVSSNEVVVSGSFGNISGNNLTEILQNIDIKLNNINYLENYKTKDFETIDGIPEIMYVGKTNQFNYWYVRKVVTDAIGNITTTHANISNNPSYNTYDDAWLNRQTLQFSALEDLIFN